NFEGPVLGQITAHDVLIPDGSLNLARQDIAPLKGRGPDLEFTRGYSNLPNDDNPYEFMGYGWTHSLDLKLEPLCSEGEAVSGCVPEWVSKKLGKFFRTGDVPADPEKWTSVKVNRTYFIKSDGEWYPNRGRHGELREEYEGGSAEGKTVPDYFIYKSKGGTEYKYPYPVREKVKIPLYMNIGDDIITRIGMHPESMRLVNYDSPAEADSADKPMPAQVINITGRNGNEMNFEYEERTPPAQHLLKKVTDAVNREFELDYKKVPAGWAGDRERLVKVTGLKGDPLALELDFAYNPRGQIMSAKRADRTEKYRYEQEPGIKGADWNLSETEDVHGHRHKYTYYGPGEASYDGYTGMKFVKAVKSQDAVKFVQYP
ncbi:MAG: hypothetical protein GY743_19850, partial [Planctomycetaceae bacterium]|nr:hypothetical protein [Planctomycetaceae bacterium]